MSFRRAWRICGWCTLQGGRVFLWSTWALLLAALAGQVHLLSSRRVPVPQPLREFAERRLAREGLRFTYDRGVMDFSGRLLLEGVRLGPSAEPSSLATANFVYARVDPWRLLVGRLTVEELRIDGLDLHLPASASGTGADQIIASALDLSLCESNGEIDLSYLNGYIGRLPVHVSGRFRPSAPRPEVNETETLLQRVTRLWFDAARKARAADAWLAAADSPRLRVLLTPDAAVLHVGARSVDLSALPDLGQTGRIERVRAETSIPFNSAASAPLTINGSIGSLSLPQAITATDLDFRARTAGGAQLRSLELRLASVRWRDIESGPVAATVTTLSPGLARADVSLALAGGSWSLKGDLRPHDGEARVSLDGFVGDGTLAFAGGLIKKNLSALLDPEHPAPLHATAAFGPGWRLASASGRLHSGSVRVGNVQLDETGTEFFYDGARVLCDNLVLRQGSSLAHGSYEMDTRTMDFRFLLTGGLRPMGISGWFHGWWTDFWGTFDFERGVPVADVDVRGRWGDLTATHVFVEAEGRETGLKGVPFDRVRTRLYLRPHWFDILHFAVSKNNQGAEGRLARSLDLEKNTWKHMEFSVDSTLPLETIGSLFKAESAELLAPYRFTRPPSLRLAGRVDSAASPAGKREHIDIALKSTGDMTYHGFPLSDLEFQARLRDDSINLPVLSVGFAEGRATGNARLWGPADARRLAFDIGLRDANLGAVTRAVAALQPTQAEPSEKAGAEARERKERLDRGRLDFALEAEGPYNDFHGFTGVGHASITGAELGQLNLFGPLSEALRGTFINLGSFSLNTVEAPFILRGDRVRFNELRVTGPSALLEAKGAYHLRDGRLDFTTKIHPFDESSSMVGNAVGFVLTPLSKVFEVKLQGTLTKPSWIFAYGPSRLLNSLGSSEKTSIPDVEGGATP